MKISDFDLDCSIDQLGDDFADKDYTISKEDRRIEENDKTDDLGDFSNGKKVKYCLSSCAVVL